MIATPSASPQTDGLRPGPNRRSRGSALVIALTFITLLTFILLAFITRTESYYSIESNAAGRVRSEIFARSALEYTVGLITREITDPSLSSVLEVGDTRFFIPKGSGAVMPKVQVPASIARSKPSHYPSIVKCSIDLFDPAASPVRTSTPNKQGRYIHAETWNEPNLYLAIRPWGSGDAPFWIYFNEQGSTREATPGIIGRTAFTIHQIDCLIDYSVAGYPKSMAGDIARINSLKGSMAGADLSQVMTVSPELARDPDIRFVDVRSRRTVREGSYRQHVLQNNNGFIHPPDGDTQFVSRLDLLRFNAASGINFNPQSYMTPWTRAQDAPSWNPPRPNSANVFAPAVLRTRDASITDYLVDGTTRTFVASRGSSVAARRFALNRIGFFDLASQHQAAALLRYFGLTRASTGEWIYADPHVKTLAELVAEDREPNFFEMLKAAIVSDSLGRFSAASVPASSSDRDADRDLQILRIGANIIDSARANNLPTVILMSNASGTTRRACGVKDLPYLHHVRFRQITKTGEADSIQQVDQYAIPVLVNPHAAPVQPVARPSLRMRLVGSVSNEGLTSRFTPDSLTDRTLPINPDDFRTPLPPRKNWLPPTSAENPFPAMPDNFAGDITAFWLATGSTKPNRDTALQNFNLVLEYLDPDHGWIVYDSLVGVGVGVDDPAGALGPEVLVRIQSSNKDSSAPTNATFEDANTQYFLKPDPRTTRWGGARGATSAPLLATSAFQVIPSEPVLAYAITNLGSGTPMQPNGVFPLLEDPDAVVRKDDLAIGSQATPTTPKTMKHVLADVLNEKTPGKRSEERNLILHRPFYTVGELGAVFRDDPWRTLNFATLDSGDSALLDYFTINESGPDGIVAGRININTQALPDSINTLLMDTTYLIGRPEEYITGGRPHRLERSVQNDARDIQVYYEKATDDNPLVNISNLVGVPEFRRLVEPMRASKQRQETLVRALGTAGQLRTWNFFIDIVSQTGRMTPRESTDLTADFIPHGETRLWVHIAIDRYTGKVIASHIEQFQD